MARSPRLTAVRFLVLLATAALCSCATTRDARLYPVNEAAQATGVLTAKFVASGTGQGAVEITMPDGKVLRGEFTIVRGGSMAFGSIYGTVYGPKGTATASGNSTSVSMPGGSQGIATAVGPDGRVLQCEFLNDNFSGHGFGACKDGAGALYRLQY